MFSSSGIGPGDGEASSGRPRNRRPNPNASADTSSAPSAPSSSFAGGLLSPASISRPFSSLIADPRNGAPGRTGPSSPTAAAWAPSWASLQEFTSSLFSGTGGSGSGSTKAGRGDGQSASRNLPSEWGPAPPGKTPSSSSSSSRPRVQDVAAGQVAARDAELKARKTASVLESHPGVNGGLDVRGKYKRRTSDETPRGTDDGHETEECLVYIHRVKPTDTYFGIVLKYRCHDDTFRKSNGLWSKDSIQVRKWVVLPVDACEIKGRPCDDPSLYPQGADLLSSTPKSTAPTSNSMPNTSDYFGSPLAGRTTGAPSRVGLEDATEPPWTHVRWVRLESCPDPVEIVRMARTSLGYFPPRRKKSIRGSVSSVSTPRASLDLSISNSSLPDRALTDSPGRGGSRRHSLLGSRVPLGSSPMSSSPSRHIAGSGKQPSAAANDPRPEWMRRPGGVGSMSKSVRAPGPARDSLNKWTTKHLPGFNIETLPSMSVMGSETANFGFGSGTEAPGIVESSFEDGREVATAANQKDNGLDKAAASIETWLRSAFKGPGSASGTATPSTSFAGRMGQLQESLGDLIELEDGPGEDSTGAGAGAGSAATRGGGGSVSQAPRPNTTSGWRPDSDGAVRGRGTVTKGKKAD